MGKQDRLINRIVLNHYITLFLPLNATYSICFPIPIHIQYPSDREHQTLPILPCLRLLYPS